MIETIWIDYDEEKLDFIPTSSLSHAPTDFIFYNFECQDMPIHQFCEVHRRQFADLPHRLL